MKESLLRHAANLKQKNHLHKRWQKVVSVLACMVVFCTVYALVLPAVTMEKTAYCGKEEHSHTETCFENQLICAKADGEGAHQHSDQCYETTQVLICTVPESDGHQHTEECYATTTEDILVCESEDPEHVHGSECYSTVTVTAETPSCGQEAGAGAHHHTEECYETQTTQICGQEETEGHKHTEECYEQVFTCEKEEHTHTLACYSDSNADVEDAGVWQNTVASVSLTGNWGEDLAAVAATQNGYRESEANYAVMEDGTTMNGYTRYGAWSGEAYRDNWSAQFVNFCLSYAGIPSSAIAQKPECGQWSTTTVAADGSAYAPKKGDLVILDSDHNGAADHAGVVTNVSANSFTVVVGDLDKAVKTNTYSTGDSSVVGYVEMPENPELKNEDDADPTPEITPETTPEATPEPEPSEAPEATPTPTETPEVTLAQNTLTVKIYTDSSYETELTDKTSITVSGKLPENASVKAYPIENVTMDGEEILYAWDISIYDAQGNLWEPEDGNPVSVEFHVPELAEEEDYSIYYIPESDTEKDPEELQSQVTGNVISFEAEHFSVYALMRAARAASENQEIDFAQYITKSDLKKLVGNTWVTSAEFIEGDNIKVSLDYKIPQNTVTNENRTITYKLPSGVLPNENQSGKVKGTIGGVSYDDLGDYSISTDGTITITFNDTFLQTNDDFTGNIEFQGTAHLDENKESDEFQFEANGNTYIINKKEEDADLSVKKTAGEIQGNKITYTVLVSSKNGTKRENVKLEDTLYFKGLDKEKITISNVKLNRGTSSEESLSNPTLTKNNDNISFEISNLPALSAGESYTITYDVDYGKIIGDGYSELNNEVKGFQGNDEKSKDSVWTKISEKMISKNGSATDDKNKISWTVTINENNWLKENTTYKITDLLNDGSEDKNIQWSELSDFTIIETDMGNGWKQTTLDRNVIQNGEITIKKGCKYEITYTTDVKDSKPGETINYKNTVSIEKDGQKYEASKDVPVTRPDLNISKQGTGVEYVDDNKVKASWTSTIQLPYIGNQKNGIEEAGLVFTDTILDSDGNKNSAKHYTTVKLLTDSLVVKCDSNNYNAYKLECYDANGNVTSSDDDIVTSFKITIHGPKEGNKIDISYDTYMVITGLAEGNTVTVKNKSEVGGKTAEASQSYTKKKYLSKQGGKVEWGNLSYNTGNISVDYNASGKKLYYRIIVKPDDANEITVTDRLPDGVTLNSENVKVKFITTWNAIEDGFWYDSKYYSFTESKKPTISPDNSMLTVTIPSDVLSLEALKAGAGFCIDYVADITDSFWDDVNNNEKKYVNSVCWNGKTESQITTVTRTWEDLAKYGEQIKDEHNKVTNKVKYYVTINPQGKQLNNGNPLTLTDTLSMNQGIEAEIQLDSVKWYSYDATKENEHYKGSPLSDSNFTFVYDNTKNSFTVTVPDSMPCVLEYEYALDMGSLSSGNFNNSVTLTGTGTITKNNSIWVKEASSSATVQKGNQLKIIKVDKDHYNKTLEGAEFKLYKVESADSHEPVKKDGSEVTFITGENGEIAIKESGDTDYPALEKNTLYYFVETKAPNGYLKSDLEYYFVWLDEGTTEATWRSNNGELCNTLQEPQICFLTKAGTIFVPNERSYTLPNTGGIGTNRLTAVGLSLMAGSLMCEYVLRRRRRERRRS